LEVGGIQADGGIGGPHAFVEAAHGDEEGAHGRRTRVGVDVEYIRYNTVNVGNALGACPLRDSHEENEGEECSRALHIRTKVYYGPHPISISGTFIDPSSAGSRRTESVETPGRRDLPTIIGIGDRKLTDSPKCAKYHLDWEGTGSTPHAS